MSEQQVAQQTALGNTDEVAKRFDEGNDQCAPRRHGVADLLMRIQEPPPDILAELEGVQVQQQDPATEARLAAAEAALFGRGADKGPPMPPPPDILADLAITPRAKCDAATEARLAAAEDALFGSGGPSKLKP